MEVAEKRMDSKKLFSIINKLAGKKNRKGNWNGTHNQIKGRSPIGKARCVEQTEKTF